MFVFRIKYKELYCNSIVIPACMNYHGSEKEFLNYYREKLKLCFNFAIPISFAELYFFNKVSFFNGSFFCIISLMSVISLSSYLVAKLCANFFFKLHPCFTFSQALKAASIDTFKINKTSTILIILGLLIIPEYINLFEFKIYSYIFYVFSFFIFYSFAEGLTGFFVKN